MSALVNTYWKRDSDGTSAQRMLGATEDIRMRERVEVVRDVMVVLVLQVVFRTVMVLRSWNY
jgi:hypothetical protein